MSTITFKGHTVTTVGNLPALGSSTPDFTLAAGDLSDKSLADFQGKKKVLNIVPSLDTSVCLASARRFNEEVSRLDDTVILNISADLPFAQARVCEANGLNNIVNLSTIRSPSFGTEYGVTISDGPLAGLMSRAVLVADAGNKVVYTEQVPEIAQEPDYEAALQAVKNA